MHAHIHEGRTQTPHRTMLLRCSSRYSNQCRMGQMILGATFRHAHFPWRALIWGNLFLKRRSKPACIRCQLPASAEPSLRTCLSNWTCIKALSLRPLISVPIPLFGKGGDGTEAEERKHRVQRHILTRAEQAPLFLQTGTCRKDASKRFAPYDLASLGARAYTISKPFGQTVSIPPLFNAFNSPRDTLCGTIQEA